MNDRAYSDWQKVIKLLKATRCQDLELLAAKVVIDQQCPHDFSNACGYFSLQVAWIHGPAQLEYRQNKTKKRGIYAIKSQTNRGGMARGHFSGRGGAGNRGWSGRGGQTYGTHVINGVDGSDPTRSFIAQEWEALGPNGGRTTVLQMRDYASGRGMETINKPDTRKLLGRHLISANG